MFQEFNSDSISNCRFFYTLGKSQTTMTRKRLVKYWFCIDYWLRCQRKHFQLFSDLLSYRNKNATYSSSNISDYNISVSWIVFYSVLLKLADYIFVISKDIIHKSHENINCVAWNIVLTVSRGIVEFCPRVWTIKLKLNWSFYEFKIWWKFRLFLTVSLYRVTFKWWWLFGLNVSGRKIQGCDKQIAVNYKKAKLISIC